MPSKNYRQTHVMRATSPCRSRTRTAPKSYHSKPLPSRWGTQPREGQNMAEPRTVPVKITVDVTEYMKAIAAARPAS